MQKIIKPSGWRRLSGEKRFASIGSSPRTFNPGERTVDAVLSKGSAVNRNYGTERLRISESAVNLGRLATTGLPVLDSHEQRGISNALGRLSRVWIEGKTLLGRIRFNQTEAGQQAMEMVSRGEITAISIGYTVNDWQIRDANGKVLDPEHDRISLDGTLTFEAVDWELLEASLVTVPADSAATIRSFGSGKTPKYIQDVRARMLARQRIIERMRW
jgi:HK97 family phage prohead protease